MLKPSEDTWKVPASPYTPKQDVPDEFAVTEVVSIDSEKVTEIDEETETDVSESEGEVEETVGTVVSVVVVVPSVVVVSSLVVSSLLPETSSILLEFRPSSSDVICPQVFKNIPRMITKVIETN